MRHGTIDQYADRSSFYGLDPRAKIIAIIFFIIVVALLTDLIPLIISFVLLLSFLLISNLPAKHLLKRYALTLPFIFIASLSLFFYSGSSASIAMFIRISTCVLLLILLSSSTSFFDLLKASQRLKVPKLMITLLMFLYRYIFVLTEEYQRMRMAQKARAGKRGRHLFDRRGMTAVSQTAGMLLVRAYERGVRIYDALRSRGYNGDIKTLTRMRFSGADYAFCANMMLFSVFILWIDWMVIG